MQVTEAFGAFDTKTRFVQHLGHWCRTPLGSHRDKAPDKAPDMAQRRSLRASLFALNAVELASRVAEPTFGQRPLTDV
jgi:hypothetical protein